MKRCIRLRAEGKHAEIHVYAREIHVFGEGWDHVLRVRPGQDIAELVEQRLEEFRLQGLAPQSPVFAR